MRRLGSGIRNLGFRALVGGVFRAVGGLRFARTRFGVALFAARQVVRYLLSPEAPAQFERPRSVAGFACNNNTCVRNGMRADMMGMIRRLARASFFFFFRLATFGRCRYLTRP